ncbi:hypothetical protein CNE_BB1p11140 (plasmid) [Cupriavidus necator N-1]|uniref:Uncharacterized protein n=1 Tax=Cupriavidus necator (strain ATCC 43291 / DSM 13513 / CCUG 52238 / LMG 8453 / N-1) TaxID=1042878 RepID=F8GUW8_CUPNN|nr:hypothetical protein CNE_BB1p11140 [Cupriavidus necator N-1]
MKCLHDCLLLPFAATGNGSGRAVTRLLFLPDPQEKKSHAASRDVSACRPGDRRRHAHRTLGTVALYRHLDLGLCAAVFERTVGYSHEAAAPATDRHRCRTTLLALVTFAIPGSRLSVRRPWATVVPSAPDLARPPLAVDSLVTPVASANGV